MDTRQQKNKTVSSDEWYTPKWMIDALGPFDLDPCSPKQSPFDTASVHWKCQGCSPEDYLAKNEKITM